MVVSMFGLVSGCGYQFMAGGPGPVIGDSAESERVREIRASAPRVVVLTVQNNSFEPDLETYYTNTLRREFAAGSGATVVADAASADLQLKGTIESISFPTVSFDQTQTFENRALVTMIARIENTRTKQVIWSRHGVAASEFFITNDLNFNKVLQRRAIEQAGIKLAADFADGFLLYLESRMDTQKNQPSSGDRADMPALPKPTIQKSIPAEP